MEDEDQEKYFLILNFELWIIILFLVVNTSYAIFYLKFKTQNWKLSNAQCPIPAYYINWRSSTELIRKFSFDTTSNYRPFTSL